jgi:response regulator RpfG family c-di-GMP phosphodiesterase
VNSALLIVDDDPLVLKSLNRAFRGEGYAVQTAGSGMAGLEKLDCHDIGVVVSDRMMPEMDGIEFLETVRARHPDIVRILLTGHASLDSTIDAINRGQLFGFLLKPWSDELLKKTIGRAFDQFHLLRENKRLQRLTEEQNRQLYESNAGLERAVQGRTAELNAAVQEGILMLVKAAEAKDDDTGHHVQRIRSMTEAVCAALGFSEDETERMGLASTMHDIGKIHVPDFILRKPGSLSAEEWAVMKNHTRDGEAILGHQPFYRTARAIARSHHERWDGGGYPDGLKGENIPLAARIVTVVDVFDALTHSRPYKTAWPKQVALEEMKRLAGTVFDPRILAVFLSIAEDRQMSMEGVRSHVG